MPILETFECSDHNPPSFCHFWNKKLVFLQEPIKVQIWWDFTWAVKSQTLYTLMGSCCQNHIKSQLKNYRRVISNDAEEWSKVWKKTGLWFQMWHKKCCEFSPNHSKVQKYYFHGYFCPKYLRFELKDTEQLSFMTLNSDTKFK